MGRRDAVGEDLHTVCTEGEKKKKLFNLYQPCVMDHAWSSWLCIAAAFGIIIYSYLCIYSVLVETLDMHEPQLS
jgi:hypothetical protein